MKNGTRATFVPGVQAFVLVSFKLNVKEAWIRYFEIIHDPDGKVRCIALHNICDGSPKKLESDVIRAVEIKENHKENKT